MSPNRHAPPGAAADHRVVIQTQGLTHHYGKLAAVQDVDLSVYEGEVFGFLGPNGAGKTTTIRTLLDFIRPTGGSATIFGMDTVKETVAIRKRIGYLPSELTLWENWTGTRYIQWLETARGYAFLDEARRLADRLDYDLDRSLKGLSTGMRRKMGIIAALAHQPELLILDEPTTGLDPLMQQAFHELVDEIHAEGRTVFLSSHNLPEVEEICDRVGIIRSGRLQAVESVANLTRVAFRWITLEMADPITTNSFANIPGIIELTIDGRQLRMRVSGETNMDTVIKTAAKHTVTDISIEHPTLEEIFLTYYGNKKNKEADR